MKFIIELNGVKVEKEIPTDWDQVTYGKFLALGDASKEQQALSVFTGIDKETLSKSKITGLGQLTACLSFLKHKVDMTKFPKRILGYEVPQDLELEPYGMYCDLRDESQKMNEAEGIEKLKSYPKMAAMYITKPYDFKRAEQVAEQLLNAPCTEVLALGNFLLLKLIALNSTISPTSLKRLTPLKRLKLVLKSWRARLAFQVRFFIFSQFHPTIPKES